MRSGSRARRPLREFLGRCRGTLCRSVYVDNHNLKRALRSLSAPIACPGFSNSRDFEMQHDRECCSGWQPTARCFQGTHHDAPSSRIVADRRCGGCHPCRFPGGVRAGAGPAPKLTQILKKDIEGQGQAAQETVVSIVEFGPGVSAPWHMHPSAQETLYNLDGNVVVEVEGRGTSIVKLGEASIIPGDIPHLARNESASATVKALIVHTRGVKDKPFVVPVRR
jgi:quercetin dioxygenase-like cupin family protein